MALATWPVILRGDGWEEVWGGGPACQIRPAGPACNRQCPQDTVSAERQNEQITQPKQEGGAVPSPKTLNLETQIPSVAPVIYMGRRNGRRTYQPLAYQDKKEIYKVQREFGRNSEIFRGFLKATFSSNEMVPNDIKDLFRCLLSHSEYDLWESIWKRSLRVLLQELQQSPDSAKDEDNNDITQEHLTGEGEYQCPEKQTRLLTKFLLDKICLVAEKAFNQLPTVEVKGSYVNTEQFPSENFLQFLDRLRTQVERQVPDPMIQAELIKEMAQRNANEACHRVILSLPLEPPPSLAQMIEACTRKAELFSAPERNPGPAQAKSAAAVTPGPRNQPVPPQQLQQITCFQCKKTGHYARDCPHNQKQKKTNKQKNQVYSEYPP